MSALYNFDSAQPSIKFTRADACFDFVWETATVTSIKWQSPVTVLFLLVRGWIERGFGLEDHKWLKVSLEILVQTPLEKQLDPMGPIASRGRFVRPSVKYVDD